MRGMVYKSISVVLIVAVVMIVIAAHHEKENHGHQVILKLTLVLYNCTILNIVGLIAMGRCLI